MQINITLNKRNIIYANFALAYHELELSFTTLHRFPFLIQTHINMLIKTKTLKIECIIFFIIIIHAFYQGQHVIIVLGAFVVVIVKYIYLQLSVQSVLISTKVASSNLVHGEM